MAKFRFRLESLLKLRAAERDQRREELARAFQAERILQDQLDNVSNELKALHELARKDSEPGTVNVESLLNTHRYELLLRAQDQQIRAQIDEVAKEVERRRLALVEADRQVRLLEKLREKKLAQFQYEELQAESKYLDEIAQIQHNLESRES